MAKHAGNQGGRPLDFTSEKEFCDYLELNLNLFCRDILDEELLSYVRESGVLGFQKFGPRHPRVDFFVKTKSGNKYLLECKNPRSKGFAELSGSLSQLMCYGQSIREYEGKCRLILVTSHTIPIIQQTIMSFNLPISVAYITRKTIAYWDKSFQRRLIAGEVQEGELYVIPQ